MKKVLILIAFAIISLSALSQSSYQPFTWSVRAGANFSKETAMDLDFRLGYQFGVGAEYNFTENWLLESALIFISKGAKRDNINLDPANLYPKEREHAKLRVNKMYLQIPLTVAYRLRMGRDRDQAVWLAAGPYIACGVGGKTSLEKFKGRESVEKGKENTFGGEVNRIDFGFTSNINFEYKHYMFSIFGEWGVTKVVKPLGTHNQTYGCNLGYRF